MKISHFPKTRCRLFLHIFILIVSEVISDQLFQFFKGYEEKKKKKELATLKQYRKAHQQPDSSH